MGARTVVHATARCSDRSWWSCSDASSSSVGTALNVKRTDGSERGRTVLDRRWPASPPMTGTASGLRIRSAASDVPSI